LIGNPRERDLLFRELLLYLRETLPSDDATVDEPNMPDMLDGSRNGENVSGDGHRPQAHRQQDHAASQSRR